MIGAVRISNWKRHRAFEHAFAPGLNFILGPNGRGKTSLLEAVRFGLFGLRDVKETREPVTIGRSIDDRGRITETVNIASESTAHDVLLSRFGADPAFLRALVFLGEGEIYAPGADQAGLEQQLESLLPISGLSGVLRNIQTARKPLTKEQRLQRTALQLSRDEIAQLAHEEVRHRAELDELRVQEAQLQDQYLAAADRARAREGWARQRAELDAWQSEVADFVATAKVTQLEGGLDQTGVELDHRQHLGEEKLRSVTEQRGELVGRIAAIRRFIDDLDQPAGQPCPLCKQPLDDDHRRIAIAEHGSELTALETQHNAVESLLAEARSDFEKTRETAERARRLSASRPSGPTPDVIPPEDAEEQLERARIAIDELRTRRVVMEQDLLEIRQRLATDAASRQLEEQVTIAFHDDALLETAEGAIEEFLADVRRSVMMPLAEELRQQWKAYRPDAEWTLALDDAGAVCLARGGQSRPYSALSGGEKMVATVLQRIAVLTAFTTSDVMVLDEPLEHLDARARRLMISSLSHAIRKGLLSQIVISTYEESLVRRLLTRPDVHAVWLDGTSS